MRMILILLITAATSAFALTACGEDGDAERPTVAASTGILADITAALAGDELEVVQVIPDSAGPHDFQPSAEDRQRLAEAELVIVNGGGLDASVPVDDADAPVWMLIEHAPDPLAFGEEHADEGADEEHAEGEEHEHEDGVDPHVWMDPTRVAATLRSLADALAEADPAGADDYRRRAGELARSLRELDRELAATLRSIHPDERTLVTYHDALGYFADRYGLEVVGTPFPATGAEAEPSAAALAEVIEAVRRTDTRALFAEEADDAEVLETVGKETGAAVVTGLLVESPGSAGTYEEMLRRDAELIASALGR